MQSLSDLLQQGTAHAWLFMPTAILLGVLHGLEPGHSKTMMAAFIIAIRGSVTQAVLLGLSAALSHSAVVWIVAIGGQYLGRTFDNEALEAWLQVGSAAIVILVALWMMTRTWKEQTLAQEEHHHHHHGEETRKIDTGHGVLSLEIFEQGVPPRWRIRFDSGHHWQADDVLVTTETPDSSRQAFRFTARDGFLESLEEIPEPHEFMARLSLGHKSLGHAGHAHDYDVSFVEAHSHAHDPMHEEAHGLGIVQGSDYMDAHERAHANDIARRFASRKVTTGQIILFGLTGGLIPCPAAITVLLLCLQLKQLALGVVLVSCFSLGLAVTMVSAGVIAALSIRQVEKRWSGFGVFLRRAPYASGLLMLFVGVYMAASGWHGLLAHSV